MPSVDLDLNEKLFFKKLLWKQGYFSFFDVPVINYRDQTGDLKRDDLTDIDVLGYSFDEMLLRTLSLGDCKSNDESHNRLLWLKGFQAYLGADHATFIGRKISAKFVQVGRRLDLSIFQTSDIEQMLADQEFAFNRLALFDPKMHELEKKYWTSDSDEIQRKFLIFLRYTYWVLPPKRRLQSLIHNFNQTKQKLDGSEISTFLIYHSLIRVALSLLDIGSYVLRSGSKAEVHSLTESFLFGSPEEVAEKKYVMEKLKRGKHSDFYPAYYPELLDIVLSLVRRSDCSRDICRVAETYWFECELAKRECRMTEIFGDTEKTAVTIKLLKDVSVFMTKATGISTNALDKLLKQ